MEIEPSSALPDHPHLTLVSDYSELTDKQQRIVRYVLEHATVDHRGKVDISPVRAELRSDGHEGNATSYIYQILGQHFAFDRDDSEASQAGEEETRHAFQEGFVAGWRAALTHGDSDQLPSELSQV